MAPDLGNVGEVEVVAPFRRDAGAGRAAQDIEAFRIGLHHSVFDAVVDHLDEMAGPVRSAIRIATLGAAIAPLATSGAGNPAIARGQGREDRIEPLSHRAIAADHQAIAALETEDAPAGADIEIL